MRRPSGGGLLKRDSLGACERSLGTAGCAMIDEPRELLRRAYEAGYRQGLAGVYWADAEMRYKSYMFEVWIEALIEHGGPLAEVLAPSVSVPAREAQASPLLPTAAAAGPDDLAPRRVAGRHRRDEL